MGFHGRLRSTHIFGIHHTLDLIIIGLPMRILLYIASEVSLISDKQPTRI